MAENYSNYDNAPAKYSDQDATFTSTFNGIPDSGGLSGPSSKTVTVSGAEGFMKRWKDFVLLRRKAVLQRRYEMTRLMVTSIIDNVPVWSGQTIRSLRVSNTTEFAPLSPRFIGPVDPHSQNGWQHEAQRPHGVELAMAQIERARDIPMSQTVYITMHSIAWSRVEEAAAPSTELARNKAVVTELAKEAVRARFGV